MYEYNEHSNSIIVRHIVPVPLYEFGTRIKCPRLGKATIPTASPEFGGGSGVVIIVLLLVRDPAWLPAISHSRLTDFLCGTKGVDSKIGCCLLTGESCYDRGGVPNFCRALYIEELYMSPKTRL